MKSLIVTVALLISSSALAADFTVYQGYLAYNLNKRIQFYGIDLSRASNSSSPFTGPDMGLDIYALRSSHGMTSEQVSTMRACMHRRNTHAIRIVYSFQRSIVASVECVKASGFLRYWTSIVYPKN